jgi:Na+/proline symporter
MLSSLAWWHWVLIVYFTISLLVIFAVRAESKKDKKEYRMSLGEWLFYLLAIPLIVIITILGGDK